MQPLNAVPRHTAISISAKIRFIRASLVSSDGNIFGAQITGVFVCNETCDLKHYATICVIGHEVVLL
jgi:transcription elongation factor